LPNTRASKPRPAIHNAPEHDPEKWKPVFRKEHAPPKSQSANQFNLKTICAPVKTERTS
jgi:hypothetical protein